MDRSSKEGTINKQHKTLRLVSQISVTYIDLLKNVVNTYSVLVRYRNSLFFK